MHNYKTYMIDENNGVCSTVFIGQSKQNIVIKDYNHEIIVIDKNAARKLIHALVDLVELI